MATSDRRGLLRQAALAGGAVLVAGATLEATLDSAQAAISTTRKSRANDIRVLNYLLLLEYTQQGLYEQAIQRGTALTTPLTQRFATEALAHERAHVTALRTRLGRQAVKVPVFTFGASVLEPLPFLRLAITLEDVAVSAYAGQVGNVQSTRVLAGIASIMTVEARHASWARFLANAPTPTMPSATTPAPLAFDLALSERNVRGGLDDLGLFEA